MPFEGMDFGLLTRGVPQVDVAGSIGRGLQLRDMMQARKDDDAMRELSQQAGGDLGQLADLAQGKGLYKQAQGIRKQQLDAQKEMITIREALGRVDKQRRDAIAAGNEDIGKMAAWADTPEKWNQGIQVVLQDHPILTNGVQPFLQFSPENRKAVMTRAATVSAALSGLQPKVEERNGAMVPVTTDVLGQQTVGAPVGFKAQDPLAQLNQDVRNGLVSEEDAFMRRKMLREGKPSVVVNTGEKLPPGWRQDPENPGAWKPIPGGPANKEVPSSIVQGFVDNEKLLGTIQEAIQGVQKNPGAIGFKNLMPDSLVQRADPEGASTRALIAQVGSLKYKDMSGAAVTVSEDQRMAPYIPKLTDSPEVVATKLQGLAEEIQRVQKGTATAYKDGHRLIPQFKAYLSEQPKSTAPASRWKPKPIGGTPDMTTLGKNPRVGPNGVWVGAGAPDGAGWYVREGSSLRRVE